MPVTLFTPAIGPLPVAAPASLVAYLTSIGKASWYGQYLATAGKSANSDGSGSVADGGAVGKWAANQAVGWTASFIQPTAASRPLFSTSVSTLGPVIYGNGTSATLYLDQATALDKDCTVLVSTETLNAYGYLFTQNMDNWSYYTQAGQPALTYYAGSPATGANLTQSDNRDGTATNWQFYRRLAISSGTSTARYGQPFRLLGTASGSFTAHRIAELWFVPKLTRAECNKALAYLI